MQRRCQSLFAMPPPAISRITPNPQPIGDLSRPKIRLNTREEGCVDAWTGIAKGTRLHPVTYTDRHRSTMPLGPRFLTSCLYACLFLLIASTFLFHGRLIYQLFYHESNILGLVYWELGICYSPPTHHNKHQKPSQSRVDRDSILIGRRSRNLKLGRRVWMLRIKPPRLFVPAPPLLKAPLARTSNPLSTVCFSKPYGLDLQCRTKIDTSTV